LITDFKLVAKYFAGHPHQEEALDWLWQQVGPYVKEEFTRQWRQPSEAAKQQEAPVATSSESAPAHNKTNAEALELMKRHEGFRTNAYLCPAAVWTIGYGTTRMGGRAVRPGDVVTEAQAMALFQADLTVFERAVDRLVQVPLTSNQFSALVSFVYNVGVGAFTNSTLLRVLNARNYAEAAEQFLRWTRGGGRVLPGLVRRRQEERALFLK
jgi:lysozyme